jgi:hypothetical protein
MASPLVAVDEPAERPRTAALVNLLVSMSGFGDPGIEQRQ